MAEAVKIWLRVDDDQYEALGTTHAAFIRACNYVMGLVHETGCQNRVAIHHLAYRSLREKFPNLGAQLSCNAVYAVSRIVGRRSIGFAKESIKAPSENFTANDPVIFDRHTLSLKNGCLSIFTLEGRMKLMVNPRSQVWSIFPRSQLKEVQMFKRNRKFFLIFLFQSNDEQKIIGKNGYAK